MENNELYHFGIFGMKWGVRRYQNPDGSRTEEGKRHYGYKFIDSKPKMTREEKRLAKKEKKRLKQEAKLEKLREKHEKARSKALKSGSAEDILKYKDELTLEEKQEAFRRLRADSDLMSIANQEAERNARLAQQKSLSTKLNKFSKGVETTGNLVMNMSKLYNNSAKVINAFGGTELPIIGEKEKKRKTRTMELAEDFLVDYMDMSSDEIKKMDLDNLKDINDRLDQFSKLEKFKSGQSGKKK